MKINIPDELKKMMPKENGPAPNIDEETRQKQDEKKKKNRNRALAVLGILILIFIFTNAATGCLYRVDEQEAAVVTMFGNVIRTDTAGLYFKIPLIQQVRKVDTTIHGTGIGYAIEGDGQTFTVDTEGIMITSDFNLIDIDFYMEYRVSDPIAYLYNSGQPELILKNIALAAIRSTVIDYTVDDAMTTGKAQIQAEVKAKIQETLEEQNIGLSIVNITVQDAEPPTREIVGAFKAVETAKQGKDTAINNANKYKNEQIPAAEAAADKIIKIAEAEKTARIAEAEGQVARFNAMYEQYALNPNITKQRMFYEAMENVLPDTKVIISDGSTQTIYPLDSFAKEPSAVQ
jgi:membrane protease subunit HflK